MREELRLDVDGQYPQMVASGTAYSGLSVRVHWIANLTASGTNRWTGAIWYKDGNVSAFPYTNVEIHATRSWYSSQRKATVRFTGGGALDRVRTYGFKSRYFHPVEFEFDTAQGTNAVTGINTCAHPNRPPSLRCENLTIETVYPSSGLAVPLNLAGGDARWSDQEMHDAMQTYWSHFAHRAQWSLWTFFASMHEMGTSLGGIMFDDIGPNHRQGSGIFNDSFISNPPSGDSAPNAWVQRMRFWTACHEMGHCFNLAHSWQKQHPSSWGTPWIPLTNEPEARSFMNYPYNVSGGQSAFFSDFEYRFSDGELLFMRHAPARFVQPGNADWFDHHGFEQAEVSPEPRLKLEVRVNRQRPLFEFLEPVVLELKLTNVSTDPHIVDEDVLAAGDLMTVILKKQGKPARQFFPYATYCWEQAKAVLMPGESIYETLFPSTGINGWDLAEPGIYTVQVALHLEGEDVVSNRLELRIAPPRGYDEEFVAQDFFSEDVGRILTFDGSHVLSRGNDTLREVVDRFGDRKAAVHARVALGSALANGSKQLSLPKETQEATAVHAVKGKFKLARPKVNEARKMLGAALTEESDAAAETLGHIDYKYYVDRFTDWLAKQGERSEAAKIQGELYKTLSARKVLESVLKETKERAQSYKSKK
jgi:hypothetical protein